MRKLGDAIMQFYNSLTSRGKLILAFAVLVILMLFSSLVINNSYRTEEINYNKLTAVQIIEKSDVIYSRNEIASLDEITEKILKIHTKELVIKNDKVSIRDLYNNTVLDNYKKELSYRKFKKKLNHFYDKVFTNRNSEYLDKNINFIEKVYFSYDYNMYIIEIREEFENENTYLGIRLINNNEYKISFVE